LSDFVSSAGEDNDRQRMRRFVTVDRVVYHSPMIHKLLILAIFALVPPTMAMDNHNRELDSKVQAALPLHVGSCVIAVDNGKVVYEQARGLADIESKTPCTPTTNYRMASVSKQFTATAVMLLVDRGKLNLGDTLNKFFPGYPDYGNKITVKHLLVHTSGLPDYEDLIPKSTSLQLDDLDVLHLLMDTKDPKFAAGAKWAYSNSGYTLLGLIVEVVSEKPFHEFMLDEVLRPVGMTSSVLFQLGLNEIPHRAYGHSREQDTWARTDQSLTSAIRGDGAIYTSLNDYQKWLRGIEEQKLLSKESYDAMFSPQALTDRNGAHYGYGWFLDEYRGEPRIYHNGETQGFRLCVQRFPKRKAAVLVQLNNNIEGDPEEMTKVGQRVADLLIFDRAR
jgi:CubicO group peptidase (beta-lactamase class C family)